MIKNGKLVYPSHIDSGEILIEKGKISQVGKQLKKKGMDVIDAREMYVSPGFIDLQVNGLLGVDFGNFDVDSPKSISDYFYKHGTTGFLATLITNKPDRMKLSMERIVEANIPGLLGLHLEGPFISKRKKGAHNSAYIEEPTIDRIKELLKDMERHVKLVTLAPELPKSLEIIKNLNQRGVTSSIGHTDATYEEALRALEEGASCFTHLYNGMRGFHHRKPGCVGAALDSKAYVGIINDGLHLHPAAVRLTVKVKSIDKVFLVSDCISATGMKNGQHKLGDQTIVMDNGVATLEDGTLAGSVLTMDRSVHNLQRYAKIDLSSAVRTASLNPVRVIGLDGKKGSLTEGKDADIAIFDDDLNVHYTIAGGEIVYSGEQNQR